MTDRKLAPHVARAIGAAQAKPDPARSAERVAAPHLSRALAAGGAPQAKLAGGRPGPAPHVRQAVARCVLQQKTPPSPRPAPHLAAALAAPPPVVQKMELSPEQAKLLAKQERRRRTLERATQQRGYIDTGIGELHRGLEKPFFTAHHSGPVQDFKVGIAGLETAPLGLDLELSQLSNFSTSIKDLYGAKPEVQTAIVRDKSTNQTRVKLSTNFNAKNKRIRKDTGGTTLKAFYGKDLRPSHVAKRHNSVKSHLRRLDDSEIEKTLEETWDPTKGEKEFDQAANLRLAKIGHLGSRQGEVRRRIKSTRQLALNSAYSDALVEVADNPFDYHAESAVLDECIAKNEELQKIIGTKVPCLACKAHFAGKSVPGLLLRHTSFGWVSSSSMKQLGRAILGTITQEDVAWYLNHLHKTLGGSDLKAYAVSSGKISVKDLTVFDDPSDSEDEEAQTKYDYRVIGDLPLDKTTRKRGLDATGDAPPARKKQKVKQAEERDQKIKSLVETFKGKKFK
jgi:hypothetical protein